MILTGAGERAFCVGADLKAGGRSGLDGLEKVLTGIEGLSWVKLGRRDVVRHRIVSDIVGAYEAADRAAATNRPA